MKKAYLFLIFPLVLAVTGIIVLASGTGDDGGYISGVTEVTDTDVAAKIPGRIDSVFVKEGDMVCKGQILARLEGKEISAKVEQTVGLKNAAKARYIMALNGARKEEKEALEKLFLQAKHQFELAEKTYNRIMKMYSDSLISLQEKDQYEFQYRAAREQMEAAGAKYQMALNGVRYEEIDVAQSAYYQAENGYLEAMAYKDELLIKAPVSGELQKRIVDPGEIISAGYPVFTILDLKDVWVTIQLKEDMMSKISKGKVIKGRIPALGNGEYEFYVSYISPMADYANWKPTNQKGDFDIRTFEIRLRGKSEIEGLRPGMTVNFKL